MQKAGGCKVTAIFAGAPGITAQRGDGSVFSCRVMRVVGGTYVSSVSFHPSCAPSPLATL